MMFLHSYALLFILSLLSRSPWASGTVTPGFSSNDEILQAKFLEKREPACSGTLTPKENITKWWRAEIQHNGSTPYSGDPNYKYYRSVLEYGADPTGQKDSSDAFNDAISLPKRTGRFTTQPVYIYVPPGRYLIKKKPISLLVSTFLVGDAVNLPTLVAHPDLADGGGAVIYGHDSHFKTNAASQNFYISVRNFIIDISGVEKNVEMVGIDWGVSQGCWLGNVRFMMASNSASEGGGGGDGNENKHVGINMSQFGSGIEIADCTFTGGGIGIAVQSQQYLLKNLVFDGCRVGVSIVWSFVTVIQGCTFRNCEYGIDTTASHDTNMSGTISVVDSTVEKCSAGIKTRDGGSLVLDFVSVSDGSPAVVALNGDVLLDQSVPAGQTWVMGNMNPGGHQSGTMVPTSRPKGLLSGDKYFTMPLPQYENYPSDQVVSITGDADYKVYGDGSHNDGPAINALLQRHAGCKIIFFPQGIYNTNETIQVPPGSRLVGEAFSIISGAGSLFSDAENPQPIVRVGNSGDKGVAQLTDMVVSVAEVLPGATLVEVNMAGENPGDVGFWNCVFRVGGTADTAVNCPNPDPVGCKAAFALLHVTETASGYFDNVWGWVADHNLDDMSLTQNLAVGRGVLVESTSPTWFVASSFEHCVLYQYALHDASNVYMGLVQTESPYWQGQGTTRRAPTPWKAIADIGDPTFNNCASQGQPGADICYRSWALYMSGSQNVVIHGSALWAFFNSMDDNSYEGGNCDDTGGVCQQNVAFIEDARSTYWYSAATKAARNMIYDVTGGGEVNLTMQAEYTGSWGGALAAYLRDIDPPSGTGENNGQGKQDGPGDNEGSGKKNSAAQKPITSSLVALGILLVVLMLI
ncbi:pectate lyase superfamily protein-domain-containing protein [Rhypophila decipiens]|uniref:Pectate lyase superfamily protein-domain-containing protein n=1 Tax=Rhypophila decipiens TaxID=261697 RepID=A0AAN6YFJ1_9PEZI|nr:pectate lyase superfamily protein-domain-containing protein [Rhypophila decipiens]